MLRMKRGVPLSRFEAEMSAALLNVDIHSSGFMYGLKDPNDQPNMTVMYNYNDGMLEKLDLATKDGVKYCPLNRHLRMAVLPRISKSKNRDFGFTAIQDAIRGCAEGKNWYWFIPKSILKVTTDQPDEFNELVGSGCYRLSAVPKNPDMTFRDRNSKVVLKNTEHKIISVNRGFEAFYLVELPYHDADLMIFEPELNGLASVFRQIRQVDGFVKNPY